MKVIDFVVGKTYLIKEKDITFPDGEIEGGRNIIRKILKPADQSNSCVDGEVPTDMDIEKWSKYLRVQCPQNNTVHLLSPDNIASATLIETELSSN